MRRSCSRSARRGAVAALSLRSVRRVAVAALSLTLGSPRCGGAPAPLGSPLRAAVSGGGKGSLCDLRCGALAHAWFAALRRSRSRSVRRFGAALPLALGSPPSVRLSVLRRSRSRSARRFGAAFRFAALSLRSVRRLGRRSRSRPGGFYLINIYLNIIINQSRRRREAPAFRTAKKYAPSGGVFPLSDIYFCFAYSAIALYFSKSSGRRMRALAGLVEGSSMHGMQPQGSQNRL